MIHDTTIFPQIHWKNIPAAVHTERLDHLQKSFTAIYKKKKKIIL